MKYWITGGTIVNGSGRFPGDVLVEEGKIRALGTPDEIAGLCGGDACTRVDASGCLVFPGFIDAHTHFDLHVAGTVTADDFATGTRAAIKGGTTTIVDFATQYPGESLRDGLDNWHKKADGQSSCDYAFHLAITDWNEEISQELGEIVAKETMSFKL